MGQLWRRLLFFIRRAQQESELEEEMRLHLEMRARKNRQRGMISDEAEFAARRSFGNRTSLHEASGDIWAFRAFEAFARDFRLAVRSAFRHPGFSATAIASLALAIGANSSVFAFVNGIVLKRLPVHSAERLVLLRQNNEMFGIENCCFTYRFFAELRRQDVGFEDVLAVSSTEINLTDVAETERLNAELVSGNYFSMLGVRPAIGRLLDESDDRTENSAPFCVISHRLWQERFGGRHDVLGRAVELNTRRFQIVGVAPQGFTGAALHEPHDIFISAAWTEQFGSGPRDRVAWAQLLARLRPNVATAAALAKVDVIGRQIQRAQGFRVSDRDVFFLRDGTQGIASAKQRLGKPVVLLLALVGSVLLIACANLAALSLVRAMARQRDAGVRIALGATRWALLRQSVAHSLLLASIGGSLGWMLSLWLIQVLLAMVGMQGALLESVVKPDAGVFAFTAALTLTAGLAFGVLPALRLARTDPMPVVHGAVSRRNPFAWRVLVACQVALSLALVFGAGLFSRSLRNLQAIDLGFRPENVVSMHIDLGGTAYNEIGAAQFFHEILARSRELQQVRSAGLTTLSILSGSMRSISLQIPGYVPPNGVPPVAYFTAVSPGYLGTLGIPLLAGRDFHSTDRGSGEGAVIVNEQFARRFLEGNALGATFSFGGGRKARVVGVAGTAKFRWIREEPHPVIYLPVTQWSFPKSLYLQARVEGDPGVVMEQLRAIARDRDPRAPITRTATMEMQIDEALSSERMLAFLSSMLSLLALAMAALGLYGLLSFAVARRAREIAIRMALGAPRPTILAMLLGDTGRVVLAGVVAGIPLAYGLARYATSLLYGVEGASAGVTLLAVTTLVTVSAVAATVPATRALRLDPSTALREE